MHLQSLQSPCSTFSFGSPGFALRPPHLQSVMEIGNLLNAKGPSQRPTPSRSPSSPGSSLNQAFSQAHLTPNVGYHSQHSSTSDLSFGTRSPAFSRPMAQVSSMQRPPQPSPASAPYAPEGFQYQPQPGLTEPPSSSSQLPYDPVVDRKPGMAPPGQGPIGQPAQQGQTQSEGGTELPKAFACSTCQKGFARRSDLVRHGTFRMYGIISYTKKI